MLLSAMLMRREREEDEEEEVPLPPLALATEPDEWDDAGYDDDGY
jgi:hypothetical protein